MTAPGIKPAPGFSYNIWNKGLWAETHHHYQLPIKSALVEQLRKSELVISRPAAHKILRDRVEEMRLMLRNGQLSVVEDLTHSGRPWVQIVAGASDSVRSDIVGDDGIVQFFIEMHNAMLCPYDKQPQINFAFSVASWAGSGNVSSISSSSEQGRRSACFSTCKQVGL